MAEKNIGKITQIISAVIDIKFAEGNLPEINSAINIKTKDGGKLVVEVAQHLGDDTVRCIALGPTDGLVRGMEAEATGAPISVPVGEQTLGRIFNVLGDPIDNKPAPEVEHMPIHRKAPSFVEQATNTEMLETGIRGEAKEVVSESNSAQAMKSGELKVYATPSMIALMEQAAYKSVAAELEEGKGTVGTLMNVSHISATPLGMEVTAKSELVEIDRKRLVFKVEAFDERGRIGEGTHERFVIDNEKFQEKANNK